MRSLRARTQELQSRYHFSEHEALRWLVLGYASLGALTFLLCLCLSPRIEVRSISVFPTIASVFRPCCFAPTSVLLLTVFVRCAVLRRWQRIGARRQDLLRPAPRATTVGLHAPLLLLWCTASHRLVLVVVQAPRPSTKRSQLARLAIACFTTSVPASPRQ